MKKFTVILALVCAALSAQASVPRNGQFDNITAQSGSTLAVPTAGSTIESNSNTSTETNKTLDGGSNTFTNIPVSALAVGAGGISVSSGGTGATSFTVHGVIIGEGGTSALAASTAGTAGQALISGGAGADPAFAALDISTSAVTGTLPVGKGGTGVVNPTSGSIYLGAGSSPMTAVAPGTSGNVLTSNGSTWASSPSASGGAANVVATVGSPQSISAGTAVLVSSQIVNGPNLVFISGNGGPVTVTATPSVTACTAAGEQLQLIGGTNNVTLQDTAGLAGSKLKLNGTLILGTAAPASYSASFVCDAASGNWVELARY